MTVRWTVRAVESLVRRQGESCHSDHKSSRKQAILTCFRLLFYFQPEHDMFEDEIHDPNEGADEMFRFIKIMKTK